MEKYGIPTAKASSLQILKKPFPISEGRGRLCKGGRAGRRKRRNSGGNFGRSGSCGTRIMVNREFGDAGSRILIEEFLAGEEVTVLAFDGKTIIPWFLPRTIKRLTIMTKAPIPAVWEPTARACLTKIFGNGLKAEILYPPSQDCDGRDCLPRCPLCRLMITASGPKVLEYNVRFGDPECQVILPRLKSDLAEIMLAVIDGKLEKQEISWYDNHTACVVMASEGYPGAYETGKVISGLEAAEKMPGVYVFHAGTAEKDGYIATAGGRVLGVTAWDKTLQGALERAYRAVNAISFAGARFRSDIGQKALRRNDNNYDHV